MVQDDLCVCAHPPGVDHKKVLQLQSAFCFVQMENFTKAFILHMPGFLYQRDPETAKSAAMASVLDSCFPLKLIA